MPHMHPTSTRITDRVSFDGGVYSSHVRLEVILSHTSIRDIKIEIVPEQNKIFQEK